MTEKRNAVMISDISAARMGMILLQLKETNQGLFDEALIYHFSLTDKEKKTLNAIMPCRFIVYDSPLSKENVAQIIFKQNDFKRFSPLIFSRFEMFHYLEEFETVMWIDTDVLLQGDISALLEEARETGFAIYREDPENKSAFNVDYAQTNFNYPIKGYDMGAYLLCSGLIIVNKTLPIKADYTDWLNKKAIELLKKRALKMLDQGTINLFVQEFKIQFTPIGHGGKYGCWPYPGRDCSQAVLIHAWGPNKFWNDWYLYSKFPKWGEYHAQWVALGGEPIANPFRPKVSTIIPIYKPDIGYLKECLDSLMGQVQGDNFYKNSDFEVILVAEPFDQDVISSLISSYGDPRLTLIFNKERKGIAYSLNQGLRFAKGDYIARMDADDLASPRRFLEQVDYLDAHPEISMCVSNYEYFGDMNEGRVIFEGEMSRTWSLLTCPFDHPTTMFRKTFFEKNNLWYDESLRYAEDWDLWLRAFEKGMIVGCIHKSLLYHRWHNGSAGQTESSNDRMKEIIQRNFKKFGIDIAWEYVPAFSPWWGKAWSSDVLTVVKETFAQALEKNKTLRLYDQECLEKVFSLRLAEAETGVLPGLRWDTQISGQEDIPTIAPHQEVRGTHGFRALVKRILKPLYRPFRHRYEDRLINLQEVAWSMESTTRRLATSLAAQTATLEKITQAIEQLHRENDNLRAQIQIQKEIIFEQVGEIHQVLAGCIFEQAEDTRKMLSEKVFEQAENTRQMLSRKVFEQAEDTRQMLSAKVFEQTENTRQMLSGKVFEQAEDTRQMLSGKVFEQAEDTRQMLSTKVFEQTENTRQMLSGKVFEQAEDTRQMLSAKVFEQTENTRQMLSGKIYEWSEKLDKNIFASNKCLKTILNAGIWNIYYELKKGHMLPGHMSGIYDEFFYWENRYGSIKSARKVLRLVLGKIPCKSLVDIGCGSGTWLWVAQNYGVEELLGLDGEYIAKSTLMIPPEQFQAVNLEKPFRLTKRYDVAMSLEVAEHLSKEAADTFVDSLCKTSNIILFSAAHPGQGGDNHINEQPMSYWIEKFAVHGYVPKEIKKFFQNDEDIESWYRENIIIFSARDKAQEISAAFK